MSDTFDHEADAWDDLLFGRGSDTDELPLARNVSCDRCGADYLHWENTGRHWRLATEFGELHSCAAVAFARYAKP